MTYTKISITLKDPEGKRVQGQVVIRDGFALSVFSDPKLAFKLYELDRRDGLDVFYNKEHNAYIQRYPGKSQEQILEMIKSELRQMGAEVE